MIYFRKPRFSRNFLDLTESRFFPRERNCNDTKALVCTPVVLRTSIYFSTDNTNIKSFRVQWIEVTGTTDTSFKCTEIHSKTFVEKLHHGPRLDACRSAAVAPIFASVAAAPLSWQYFSNASYYTQHSDTAQSPNTDATHLVASLYRAADAPKLRHYKRLIWKRPYGDFPFNLVR